MGIVDFALLFVFLLFYFGLFYNLPVLAAGVRDLRRSSKRIGEGKASEDYAYVPSFSVVLPVKDEVRVIGRLLESLSRLSYPAERFEVVIVDDGSVDGTVEVCERFADSHGNIRLLQRPVLRGKSSALNYGLSHCSGEIVAFFDADNVPAGDVLSRAAEHFLDPAVAALQGLIQSINSHENMLTQFLAYEDAVWSEAFLRGKEKLGLFVHLRGCCQFIRRSALERVGGFDEESLAEDIEISARLTEQGERIKYASDVRVWQESPSTVRGFLTQRTRWYRGHMEVALKYGRLLKHLGRRTLDAELTLSLPFLVIASLFLFLFASCGVFAFGSFDVVLDSLMVLSTLSMYVLVFLAGGALIYYSRPKSLRNLLWLPFVFGYWFAQSFVAVYAGLLILFRRPARWVKTDKSGVVKSPEFALEVQESYSASVDHVIFEELEEITSGPSVVSAKEDVFIGIDNQPSGDGCVYVVIPCYNEERNLPFLMEDLAGALSGVTPFGIIAVDDGSSDGTGLVLKSLAAKYPIRLLQHEKNLGLSASLRDGLMCAAAAARANDLVVTMDADNTHKSCYIQTMLNLANQGADIVIASRYVRGGFQIGVPNDRILLSKCVNYFLSFLTGLKIKDETSGYRCYRAFVLKKGLQKYNSHFIRARGFEVQVELLVKLGSLSSRIQEIPFLLRYDEKKGKSKMPLLRTMQNYLLLYLELLAWKKQSS